MLKKNRETDLFDTIILTRDNYLSAQNEEQHIYEKMKKELEESARKIKLSYQERINISQNNCSDLKRKLEDYKKLLESYSTFDSKMIGHIIEKLVSLVEGEEYSYQEADHETYEREATVFGSELFRVSKKKLMIVKSNKKQGYYHDYDEQHNEVVKLIQNKEAILLVDGEYHQEKITFYNANKGEITSLVDFKGFSYVKDFLDLVIQFRFENSLDKISEKELLNLMSKFISSQKEMIEANYQKRALEKQKLLRQQLINEQLKLSEYMESQEPEKELPSNLNKRELKLNK